MAQNNKSSGPGGRAGRLSEEPEVDSSDSGDRPGGAGGTRSLVAPELLAGLDLLPSFEFNEEVLRALRSAGPLGEARLTPPPLSPRDKAVACEQRFVPGPPGAPDVRVLVYTPPGK